MRSKQHSLNNIIFMFTNYKLDIEKIKFLAKQEIYLAKQSGNKHTNRNKISTSDQFTQKSNMI